MIIQLEKNYNTTQREIIKEHIQILGYQYNYVKTQFGEYLVCIGKKEFDPRVIGHLEGIKDIHRVSDNYKLVSSKWKIGKSRIQISEDLEIGQGEFQLMAGPCSIENENQIHTTVQHLKENGIRIMRGGVFKPRSSPYSFRGLGIEGLKTWYEHASENGIKIVTEVMQVKQIDDMYPYTDIFQVGARNSQNFNLLDALGEVDKPVLLKRGMSGTLEELLQSAEYIFSHGNERILLCERGIRTFENAYRNTFDINAIAMLKEKSHLPVIADPSHGIGIRRFIGKMALASVMAGADGIILEVHETPEEAYSDGQQTLSHREASRLYEAIRKTRELFLTI